MAYHWCCGSCADVCSQAMRGVTCRSATAHAYESLTPFWWTQTMSGGRDWAANCRTVARRRSGRLYVGIITPTRAGSRSSRSRSTCRAKSESGGAPSGIPLDRIGQRVHELVDVRLLDDV